MADPDPQQPRERGTERFAGDRWPPYHRPVWVWMVSAAVLVVAVALVLILH